jgi:hypothetical protein
MFLYVILVLGNIVTVGVLGFLFVCQGNYLIGHISWLMVSLHFS